MQDKLIKAIWRGDLSKVQSLLLAGASPDEPDASGWTPLMQAAEVGSLEIVGQLLQAGADINRKGLDGQTCLHIAVDAAIDEVSQNNGAQGEEATAVIEFLIENGANSLASNEEGETPLYWAQRYKSEKVTALLKARIQ